MCLSITAIQFANEQQRQSTGHRDGRGSATFWYMAYSTVAGTPYHAVCGSINPPGLTGAKLPLRPARDTSHLFPCVTSYLPVLFRFRVRPPSFSSLRAFVFTHTPRPPRFAVSRDADRFAGTSRRNASRSPGFQGALF